MIFEQFAVGMLQTNFYLIGDPASRKAVVIDPGGDGDRIVSRVENLGLELAAILCTHAHFDHVSDAWHVKERLGGAIYLSERDESLLYDRMVGMAAVGKLPPQKDALKIDHFLVEEDLLQFGAIELKVLSTPGHTPGHMSLYFDKGERIFVGDTLFAGSIGRTDFPGGSYEQLIGAVREKIFSLPGKTMVLPGHGPQTTVDREKRSNPFFR